MRSVDGPPPAVSFVADIMTRVVRDAQTVRVPASSLPVLTRRGRVPTRAGADGAPEVVFPATAAESLWCRGLERLAAAWLLAISLPVMALAALIVRLDDGGPAFFAQDRFGRHGRPFRLYKLRTMRPGAQDQQRRLQAGAPAGRPFKLDGDPRTTRSGRWLRRHGLDELPQLLNIVRGEMRLVGPRPLPAYEEGLYRQAWQRARLAGTPGLTGLWQVSGRHAMTFDDMCVLDIWYLRNRGLWLDLRIMLRTVGVVAGWRNHPGGL